MGKPTLKEQYEAARRVCPDVLNYLLSLEKKLKPQEPLSEEEELSKIRREIAEEVLTEIFMQYADVHRIDVTEIKR